MGDMSFMSNPLRWDSQGEKVFVDSFNVGLYNGLLCLFLGSGEKRRFYILQFPCGKQLAKLLTREVKAAEKKFQIIFDDRLRDEPILSPLQLLDKNK